MFSHFPPEPAYNKILILDVALCDYLTVLLCNYVSQPADQQDILQVMKGEELEDDGEQLRREA